MMVSNDPVEPLTEKVYIAGLVRGASRIFYVWGGIVLCKGLWDAFVGEPESNLYAPAPWAFVSQSQWLHYAGFEMCYGLACIGLAYGAWCFSHRLPEVISREKIPPIQLY